MLLHKLVFALHRARQAVARRGAGDRASALDALHLPAPTIHSPVAAGTRSVAADVRSSERVL